MGSNEKRFSGWFISHIVTRDLDKTAIRLSSAENATWDAYSTSLGPTRSQVVVSHNSRCPSDPVVTIFPEGENAMTSPLSCVTGWFLPKSSRLNILTVPTAPPIKSLWPSRDGQILLINQSVSGSVSKIIFEPVGDTSHISTVSSRGANMRLVWDEWITAGGILYKSPAIFKDTICCVSSLRRHLSSSSLNAAVK